MNIKLPIAASRIIELKWRRHRKLRDPDGFSYCNEVDVHETGISKDYAGDREKAVKEQEEERKNTRCDFCALCRELLGITFEEDWKSKQ